MSEWVKTYFLTFAKAKYINIHFVAVTGITYWTQLKIIGAMIPNPLDQFVKDKNK